MTPLEDARTVLAAVRRKTEDVLVAYSGGKDSIVCMELARDAGLRVHPYFLYFVEGISFQERAIRWAEKRYGVAVRRYPHPNLAACLQGGVYRARLMPDVRLIRWRDIEETVKRETGIPFMVYGWKQSDSITRRIILRQYEGEAIDPKSGRVCPLSQWTDTHVRAFLRFRHIPLPPSYGRMGDVCLSPESLTWMHEHFPDDYQRVLAVFPQAHAQVARRQMYGAPERSKYEGT